MVPDEFPIAAAALLAVSAVLLANPLYLQDDDRGSQIVSVERTTPAEGLERRSPAVRRVDDLPVVARYAAGRSLTDGSFQVDRAGSPLALQVLARDGQFVASHRAEQLYEPTVRTGSNRSTLTLSPVSAETVEAELGLTPPAGLEPNQTLRRIAWIADRSDAVHAIGEFDERWERRLGEAVAAGELTVPNGNDASTLVPLGGDVTFVVGGRTTYRATVEAANRTVRLGLTPVSTEVLLAETRVPVVDVDDLSGGTRAVVVAAIRDEDGRTRFARDEANPEDLERLSGALLRHEGAYYVLQRSHVDDFSFLPLARAVLLAAGGLVGFVGLVALYRELDWPR